MHARYVLLRLPKVETLEEVEELVILGGRNRTVGNNNVNEHSSRSHLVLQVQIVSTDLTTGYMQHGRLNLIDLAGSERIKARHAWSFIHALGKNIFTFSRFVRHHKLAFPPEGQVMQVL